MFLSLFLSSEPPRQRLSTFAQLRAEVAEGYTNLVTALSVGGGFVVIDTAFDWRPVLASSVEAWQVAASYYTTILNTPQVVLVTMWMVYMYLLRPAQVRGGVRRVLSGASDWPTARRAEAGKTIEVVATTAGGRGDGTTTTVSFVLTPWLRRELERLKQIEKVAHFGTGVYFFLVIPNYLRLQHSSEDLATKLSLWPIVLVCRFVLLAVCWFAVRECRIGLTQLSMDGGDGGR